MDEAAKKRELMENLKRFIQMEPHIEKRKARSKQEIHDNKQITCDAQNQLNAILGLPLIPWPGAVKTPKLTPQEQAEYEETTRHYMGL